MSAPQRQLGLVGLDLERELAAAEAAHVEAVHEVTDATRALAESASDWSRAMKLGRARLARVEAEKVAGAPCTTNCKRKEVDGLEKCAKHRPDLAASVETVTLLCVGLEETVHQKAGELEAAQAAEARARATRTALHTRLTAVRKPRAAPTGTCEALVHGVACKAPAAVRLSGVLFCATHDPEAGDTTCPRCSCRYFAIPSQISTLCDACR